MTTPNQGRKRKKITYVASLQGIEKAENALKRLGCYSKSKFAESRLLSRSTVTKFFQRQPIQLDSFNRICETLKLNWKEIVEISDVEISEQKQFQEGEKNTYSNSNCDKELGQAEELNRIVNVIDKKSKKNIVEIKLKGNINSVESLKILESILRQYSGETIEIIDIKEGSIKLIVEGSQKDIKRLISQIESGELKEVDGFLIEDIQTLGKSSADEESIKLDNKWDLVREIVIQSTERRNLSSADLSDADLYHAYLKGADLSNADLSNADLSNADLSNADLSNASLNDADLSGANLNSANLNSANLSGANLRYAKVDDTTRLDDKWRLVWEVVNQRDAWQNLRRLIWEIVNQRDAWQDLSNADLSGANLNGANLSRVKLIGANLSGANLSSVNLSRADLSRANLNNANLNNAKLSAANLSASNLSDAKLSGADLSRADLYHANLMGANLNDAKLSAANLSAANLSGANLSAANLSAEASGSTYDLILSPTNLNNANLSGADLSGADLYHANLSGANLSGADLRYANLSGANLSNTGEVKNARFGYNKGIFKSMKHDLIARGAIFEDSPGDHRDFAYSPVNR